MSRIASGFADPPVDSASAFRVAMQAMARPGTIHEVAGPAPEGLSVAAALLLLTLADRTTPVRLAGRAAAAREWLTFHTGAPEADPNKAVFAAGPWGALLPLDEYPVGTPDFPDRSVTLIAELERLETDGTRLRGPGIAGTARLSLPDLGIVGMNAELYPQGIDCYFTCGNRLAALPRTTRIAEDA